MGNRYKEVLMTYVRQPFSSWQAGLMPLGGVLWVGLSCLPGHSQLFSWLLGEFFIAGSLWSQFRERMTGWWRRLTPKYTPPQILVFGLLALDVVLAIPLPAAIVQNRSYLAPVSVSILIFGFTGIAVAMPSVILLAASAVAFFLFSLNQFGSQQALAATLSGEYHILTWWLLAFGTVLTVSAVTRLAYLAEGGLGYAAPLEFTAMSGWLRRHRRTRASESLPSQSVASLSHIAAAMRGRVRWRRTRFFRLGMSLSMLPFLLIPVCVIGLTQHPSQLDVVVGSQYMLPFLALFPAISLAGRCIANFRFLATESLRPGTRSAFIKGFAASLFLNGFKAYVASSTIFLVAVYLAGGGLVGALLLVPFIVSIMLAQPLILALVWWLAQYRSAATLVVALSMSMGLGPVFFPDANYWSFLAGGAVCMFLGLILIPFVYRRWMNLEMG